MCCLQIVTKVASYSHEIDILALLYIIVSRHHRIDILKYQIQYIHVIKFNLLIFDSLISIPNTSKSNIYILLLKLHFVTIWSQIV